MECHSVTVYVKGHPNPINLSEDVVNMSDLIKEMETLSHDNIQLQVEEKWFNKFLEFCKINEYKNDLKIPTIKTNDLAKALAGNQKNYNFISEFMPKEGELFTEGLVKLYKAAEYLRCSSLIKLCAAVIACEIYFEDSAESYKSRKDKLGVKEDITFQEDEEYTRNYVFMN